MKILFLYVVTIVIWGSTWIGIKYQLGTVDPMVSVIYRFTLSSAILMVFCKLRGLSLKFTLSEHGYMALTGTFLFSLNYWLVYISEIYLTSGLVAVLFSSIVFLNIANGAVFLKDPVERKMILGALLGTVGTIMIFMPEIQAFDADDAGFMGILFGLGSVFLASLGNISSARNSRNQIPVVQANAFGMGYGALLLFVIALVLGKEFNFVMTPAYVGSLVYLAVFGTIIGFGSYLTLIGRIGADKAAYTIMVVTVVALVISSVFEGYHWNPQALFGLFLVLGGNFMALAKPPRARA